MEKRSKIYLAGHTGLIGSAILRRLEKEGYSNIITRTQQQLNLTRQADVEEFFKKEKPEYVILAAAKVGGINANMSSPAQFIYENLAIQSNVMHSAYLYKTKKLLFFASACSYPRVCPQPMKEEYLLSGNLEPTNAPYAVAKIAGITMCQAYNRQYGTNFICALPTNAYGSGDTFDLKDSHVIPALIRRFHEAKIKKAPEVTVWGTGRARREFIFSEDVASATLFLMRKYNSSEIINLGVGYDVTIKELTEIIKRVVGYKGRIVFDTSKPDGMPRKMLDVSRLKRLGWQEKVFLEEGIGQTYEWYLKEY